MLPAELCFIVAACFVVRAHKANKADAIPRCWGSLAVAIWLDALGLFLVMPILAVPFAAGAAWATWQWWTNRPGGGSPDSGHPYVQASRVLGQKSAAALRDLVGRLLPLPAPGLAA